MYVLVVLTGWLAIKHRVNTLPHNGIIRYLGFLNEERLLIVSPKALSEVLVTKNYDFEKPGHIRSSVGRILGIGVLLAEGEEHKFQRKNLMPAFSFRHVKDLYPVFWRKGCEAISAMTDYVDAGARAYGEREAALEVGGWASRVTLDIIGVAGMGRDFGAVKDPDNHLSQIYQRIFKPSRQGQMLALMGLILPGWFVTNLPVSRNHDILEANRQIRHVCMDMIREKKEKKEKKKNSIAGKEGEEAADVDILSVALESGAFSEDNLVDQVMTFLAAGHETTASAMTWAIYMLCLHPDVQTRLREEIRANLPPPSMDASSTGPAVSAVNALDIDKLTYLNAVVNEVLRYYAPVPITIRDAVRPTTIQGVHIPKGTRVIICPWATNKDLSLWGQDAGKFDPERWIAAPSGSGGASSNYAFLTFIHGPRSCMGMAFARAEFACLLATWVGRMEFRLQNEEEMDEQNMLIKGGITARPAKGLHVWAKVLDGW